VVEFCKVGREINARPSTSNDLLQVANLRAPTQPPIPSGQPMNSSLSRLATE